MAAGTLDATIFNVLHSNHTARIDAAVEVENEDKRIAKWTQDHKDKLAIETEVLGEQREKETEVFEATAKSPKKRIEKKDSVFEDERNFKNATDMAEALDPQEKALREARKTYVETEFNERNALKEVRSYFSRALGKEDKTETPNIAAARTAYEKLRQEKMDGEIAKLENGTLKGDALNVEIKKLLTYYNTGAALELYNERIAVKIAQKKETEGKSNLKNTWDKVGLGMDQVAEFYNKKVHWSIKIGLAATSVYLGAGAFKSGKNIWGAFLMATAGGAALDGAAQFIDKRRDKKTSEKEIKEISRESGEVDFEKLRGILNQKNADVDRKVNKHVTRAYFNKTVAVCLATVIGMRAVEGMAHAFEKMTPATVIKPEVLTNWPTPPSTGIPVDLKPGSPEYARWVVEHGGKPPVSAQDVAAQGKKAAEVAAGASNKAVETLTINKGSSFEGTLMKYLADPAHRENILKHKPEWAKFSNAVIADRMAIEFAHAHEEMHDHVPDYVQAGAKLNISFDGPKGLNMEISGKDYGWYEDVKTPAAGHGGGHGAAATAPVASPENATASVPTAPTENVSADPNFSQELNQDLVNDDKLKIAELNDQYAKAADVAMHNPHSLNDAFSEDLARASEHDPMAAHEAMGKIDAARKEAQRHMKTLLEMNDNETFNKIGKDFFDSKAANIRKFGNLNVVEALKDPENNLKGLSKKAKDLIVGYANNKTSVPKPGENFKQWAYRLMKLTSN